MTQTPDICRYTRHEWDRWMTRREANHRLFALGWSDPVESSLYAGYTGA